MKQYKKVQNFSMDTISRVGWKKSLIETGRFSGKNCLHSIGLDRLHAQKFYKETVVKTMWNETAKFVQEKWKPTKMMGYGNVNSIKSYLQLDKEFHEV